MQEQGRQESHAELETYKRLAAEAATALVRPGMLLGIGSGSTAAYMIRALARRLQDGLQIVGAVPTSRASEELARSLGIPLTDLDSHPQLDLAIDGADELDGELNLIKGGGGALLREKIVASCARRFVVIADVTKRVSRLGLRMPLPVEVVPFAATPVRRRLEALGASVQLRERAGRVFVTDNGNVVLDCSFAGGIAQPAELDGDIHQVVGVVESGLFLHMAQQALLGGPDGVSVVGTG
jgi:ribose 5-phosphate isomerase A